MKFINKIQKFMIGRYGIDDLYKFSIKMYFTLLILNIFLNNKILTILELLIFIITLYRFLSKKIYKRNLENQKFLKIKQFFLKSFINVKRNIKDKDHIYKKCPKCKKTLKLPIPNKKGIKHTKCPNCGNKITLYTYKHQKIEIIKNKERRK